MNKITEIIPDELPSWAKKAFDEGNFFKTAVELVEQRWISTKDKLPDYDEFVLWYSPSYGVFIDRLDKEMDVVIFLFNYSITHWQPLPSPPDVNPD